ncbi:MULTISPECIES: TetR/AcrR family transcriptional regulator [Mycobacterium]|jgi:AcrR family transcriptional regulator|uniref:Helix-turn-helix domain-containing protein n=5 Tax=Mycobacterium intracellulare TaxID=1767 RepID=X8A0V0_MYCIT|nr:MULTISPECIES: TetR/AcrR family transcriptional regulator [Mycobacterium]EUA57127.1 putative transcriptional regulator [Mycobacterium intracellulare 1956]AFC41719.1 transcriptional regulator, TetR family protein [Mycobacterium intracellulare ATCC 13950]AFC46859.1 transcriptional regulator, TetR family protein [Mycobacterium intracellulare MOTT-02]AFS12639.1 Transcriptional regulator, TetR family protein [Mycobacterium intracellulare subsp. intracellulare MTCC 9506]ASW93720.1 TetR family tran
MARWEPDARERLVAAALDLFNERGYDETTVTQIAERAGLTKSTFFRHFPDKRDVLAAGQDAIAQLLREGIATAPADATPLAAVCSGLKSAAAAFTSFNRELAPRLKAAIAASTELQERNALKQIGLARAVAEALQARGIPEPTAVLAAELGALAFKTAYARWSEPGDDRDLGAMACDALHELHAAAADLG